MPRPCPGEREKGRLPKAARRLSKIPSEGSGAGAKRADVGGTQGFVPAPFLKLRRSRMLWSRWLSIASGDTRGASEKPCVARVSFQLWLAERNEQAKAEKTRKSGP